MPTAADNKNYRITLYIDTPKPLLRPFKDFTKHNQLESLFTCGCFNPVAITGHAFIGLAEANGQEKRWGYTCKEPSLFKALGGMKGELVPEEPEAPYNEAIVWQVDREKYFAAKKALSDVQKNPGTYTLFGKNCASVATSILRAADVPDVPKEKIGLTPYGLAFKKRWMLVQRRIETAKFKIKNAIKSLFGKRKSPKSELLDSLRSKPIPVPINNAMKSFRENRDNNETTPINLNKVIASISHVRS